MKILDRYIAAAVVTGTLVALLIVVGLDIFFNVIAQFDNVGRENYTLLTLIQFVALITPQSMYELFPMAALLGSLMGMGGLSANSELVAMRASGLSIWRIIRSVLQVGVLMLIVAVFVGEVVAPVAERQGQQLRTAAMNRSVSFLSSRGLWVRDEDRFINARRVFPDNTLGELTIYEFDDDARLKVVTEAVEAHYQEWPVGYARCFSNRIYAGACADPACRADGLGHIADAGSARDCCTQAGKYVNT